MQNVLILVSCASVWQTEARLTILWRNCSFKLCYEMVSCASVWQTEARLSHLDVFGGFLMGWNRLKQYGCASAQTIVFFMEGAPSTLHTILSGRGILIHSKGPLAKSRLNTPTKSAALLTKRLFLQNPCVRWQVS